MLRKFKELNGCYRHELPEMNGHSGALGLGAQFRTAEYNEVAQLPRLVDPALLEGNTVNFSLSLIRLAWMLQHAETLLPMAGAVQRTCQSSHVSLRCCSQVPEPVQTN